MDELLQEYCDWQAGGLQVDRAAGVLRGVKVLGLASRNGRRYLPDALAAAVPLYENVRVNVNHPKGDPAAPRDYQDRLGTLRRVVLRPGEGLFADLHFNPKHQLAEQLLWDAEHAPHQAGFSHNVQARLTRHEREVVVEAITRVHSVDLVADPATTRGLFEGRQATGADESPSLAEATLDQLQRCRPDLVAAIVESQRHEIGQLEAKAADEKRRLVRRVLAECRLPDPESDDPLARAIVSPQFLESLDRAADEGAMRALAAERARLVQALGGRPSANGQPVARDQWLSPPTVGDVNAFVEAIT